MGEESTRPLNGRQRRIPGIPDHFQEFGLCILFQLTLPFVPLIAEFALLHRIEPKTFLLFVALYPLGIGICSRSRLMFGATVIMSLMYSIFFGVTSGAVVLAQAAYTVGDLCLIVVILGYAGERYNRHVVDGERFWEFC